MRTRWDSKTTTNDAGADKSGSCTSGAYHRDTFFHAHIEPWNQIADYDRHTNSTSRVRPGPGTTVEPLLVRSELTVHRPRIEAPLYRITSPLRFGRDRRIKAGDLMSEHRYLADTLSSTSWSSVTRATADAQADHSRDSSPANCLDPQWLSLDIAIAGGRHATQKTSRRGIYPCSLAALVLSRMRCTRSGGTSETRRRRTYYRPRLGLLPSCGGGLRRLMPGRPRPRTRGPRSPACNRHVVADRDDETTALVVGPRDLRCRSACMSQGC
jgi:hypothetical protein